MRWVATPVLVLLAFGAGVSGARAAPLPQFSAPVWVQAGTALIAVVAADFDGDGLADLAVVNSESSSVSVLLGSGDGRFRTRVVSRTAREPWDIASADVNGDGRPDLVTASTDVRKKAIAVLLNVGGGRFRLDRVYLQSGGAEAVVTDDVNGDGMVDLIATDNYESLTPTVLLGIGAGRFAAARPSVARTSAEDLDVGDLNGDGRDDLVIVDQDQVAIRLGSGDGTFGAARFYEAGDVPRAVALADVNHDDRLDMAVASESPGTVSMFLGNGDGTFRARTESPADVSADAVVIADLNGDGNPDVLSPGGVDSPAVVFSGHGDGTFERGHRLPGLSDESGAVADFNRDGRPDLAFVSALGTSPTRVNVLLNWAGLPAPPCVVHAFTRMALRKAKADVRSSGCRLGAVRYRYSRRVPRNRVISQRPPNGSVLPSHSSVDLLVSRGRRR